MQNDNPTPASMRRIDDVIAEMQAIKARFGNTCVYIRRGGLTWGALALNNQAEDERRGVFDSATPRDPGLSAGPPVGQKHDPKTGPCPTCGFRVRETTKKPFVIEDDSDPPPASPALHSQANEDFVIGVLRQLLTAEAAYRSAMNIYKDHPSHRARIRAESDWHHAKSIANSVAKGSRLLISAPNEASAQPVSGTEGRFDAASCWAWLNHVDSKDVETIIEQFTKSNCLEYTPEEERFGIQRALRGTVEGLLARALSSEATTASLQSQLSEARAICKSLSDTLLKLRPLGGSECFSRHGRDDTEAYYADPAYFSDLIAHDKNGWLEDRKRLIRTERDLAAAHTTIAELRGALEPIQNALQKQVNLLRFQARNSTSGLARALIETSEVWQTFCDNAEAALAPAGEKQS